MAPQDWTALGALADVFTDSSEGRENLWVSGLGFESRTPFLGLHALDVQPFGDIALFGRLVRANGQPEEGGKGGHNGRQIENQGPVLKRSNIQTGIFERSFR